MKAVVLDGYTLNPGDLDWKIINSVDDLIIYDRTKKEEIANKIGDAEIVLTNKTPIDKNVLGACPNIRFISVLATGYNVVDIVETKKRNIIVSNVPDYGTHAVSQFAIALLLEVCCKIGIHNRLVHEGEWHKQGEWCFSTNPLIELNEKTMGIIGFGRIGKRTAEIAKALGMHVIVYDPNNISDIDDIQYVSLDELYTVSDVIVLHCSLNENNYQMINKNSLNKMKKSTIIINNARGGLINEYDLAYSLNHNEIAAAGLDVTLKEPINNDNPLLKAKNCIITPHMSWLAKEARQRIMITTNQNILAFSKGKPIHVVND